MIKRKDQQNLKAVSLDDLEEREREASKRRFEERRNWRKEEEQYKPEVKVVEKRTRKIDRPIQKTLHISTEMDININLVKTHLKIMGVKTTYEDLLFDLLEEWMDEHLETIKNHESTCGVKDSPYK